MKKFVASIMALTVVLTPGLALAGEFTELSDFAQTIVGFINGTLIPLVFALALLLFIWGMFTYFILGGGDESKRESGKSLMLWAIIGFVMMIIIFGLVNLIANGLLSGIGEDNTGIEQLPTAEI
jgi:hypothetical protein